MEIILNDISKKFGRSWIFRHIDYTFRTSEKYALLGGNGSGKSTLLQIISGYISPTSGKIHYQLPENKIQPEAFYRHISMATPYLELPEEFSLAEILRFHSKFCKPLLPLQDIPARLELQKETEKQIRNFSSGMRQRLRLGLAILFQSEIILLDEPSTHLDLKAIDWYKALLQEYDNGRCLIISSNVEEEYSMCQHYVHIENYKKAK